MTKFNEKMSRLRKVLVADALAELEENYDLGLLLLEEAQMCDDFCEHLLNIHAIRMSEE